MTFQILALSGGGCLGYYSSHVMAGLEPMAGKPLARCFDVIAGTSIGGMLGLAVAAEIPAEHIDENFRLHGTHVFSDRPKPTTLMSGLRALAGALFSPKYSAQRLRDNLVDLVGDVRLGELKTPVMITAIRADTGEAHMFCSLKPEDADLKAVDVAMATTAVPTYYPLAPVAGGHYVDGGLFANAPDMVALSECEHVLGISPADIRMLSIGTTTPRFAFPRPVKPGMGAVDWLLRERLVRVTLAAHQSSTDLLMRRELGDRYLRIDAEETPQEQDMLGLDVATPEASAILERLAAESLQPLENKELLRSILQHERA